MKIDTPGAARGFAQKSMIGRHAKSLFVFLLVLAAAGCSDRTHGTVSGSVTVDGQSAKTGSIAFIPLDEKSPTSGAAIADGKYTAQVPLGNMKVEIRVPKVVGQRKLYDTPNSPVQDLMAETLPAKYNNESELRLDVKPGNIEQDYTLITK